MARTESSNPALTRGPLAQAGSVGFGRPQYGAPQQQPGSPYAPQGADAIEQSYYGPDATARDTGRLTIEDVVIRTAMMLATIIATGAATWYLGLTGLWLPAMLVGLVLGVVIGLKAITNPAVILTYAAIEGVFLGGVTAMLESMYPGIAVQAVTATIAVAVAMLFVYRSGRIRVTPRFTKIVVGATAGYALLVMVNLGLSLFTGSGLGLWNGGILGFGLSFFAIGLASLMLVIDYDFIDKSVKAGVPEKYGWYAAFGLTVTLIWLYIEMLRLISQLRGD
ncbi:MAG TPA: Bax inhibitor-1/YccA family protein [Mycobacteriales bacterium]|nr:Bax inhibitor-1/YccA family protein [Mycobacteriales bacterium]